MICTPTRTNLACKAGLKKLQRLPPTTTARLPCTSLEQEPWDELHLLRVNTRAKRLYGIKYLHWGRVSVGIHSIHGVSGSLCLFQYSQEVTLVGS